ncbi:MAG: LysM peptidoglycan-binding domain-containing protein [Chloroflexi bacterium]|nr:LysM peptidoglycan-binding domain-containing protein [Chloroflexota bacterium]
MKRILTMIVLLLLPALGIVPAVAQQPSPPPEIEVAFDALAIQTGDPINFETITRFQWEARDFPDASLGCPRPGQGYAQVITPGYQFLITYAGITYDYRVPENATDPEMAILCDSYPAQPVEPITPMPPPNDIDPEECGAFYEVERGVTLSEIAVACDTTVAELLAVNPDIVDPSLIYAGQRLAIPTADSPYTVSIAPDSGPPGTVLTLTATGFPPGARVEIGLGRFRSEYDVLAVREIGLDGTLSTTVAIPETADIGEEWVGVVVLNNQETISEVFEVTETALFDQTQIYLVALGDAGRSGMEIGCGDSLVPVIDDIRPTIAPLTAALGELLAIDTRTYGQSGLYNALYRSNLIVDGIDIQNGEAIIALSGDVSIGGVCDVPRIEQQLRQTALQYDTIDEVTISINGQPLAEAIR